MPDRRIVLAGGIGGSMLKTARLLTVPVALVLLTGCFEMGMDLTLGAKGAGTMVVEVNVNPEAVKMMEGLAGLAGEGGAKEMDFSKMLKEKMPKDKFDELKERGVKVKVKELKGKDTMGALVTMAFKDVTALSDDAPPLKLKRLADGTVEATFGGKDAAPEAPEAPEGDDAAPIEGGELPAGEAPAGEEDMMKGLMAAMGTPKLTMSLTLPGEVVSVSPETAVVSGRKVTWSFEIADMDFDKAMKGLEGGMKLVFRPDAGAVLPASLFVE